MTHAQHVMPIRSGTNVKYALSRPAVIWSQATQQARLSHRTKSDKIGHTTSGDDAATRSGVSGQTVERATVIAQRSTARASR